MLKHPLARRHPIRALFKLIIWQLQASFFPERFYIKHFVGPVNFYARKRLTGITGNIYAGLHEFDDMCFLLHFLRPGDVFFDVGANVGAYTLLAAGVCKSRSIAFEPSAATFGILQNNIALNNLRKRVRVVNAAVGATDGQVVFADNEDTTNHILAADEKSHHQVTVKQVKLDDYLGDDTPALIKIDVEGFETEVINGMTEMLKTPALKAIIIELNGSSSRYGYNDDDIRRIFTDHGFLPFHYDPFSRQLTAKKENDWLNTIFCRDLPFINERLQNAAKIRLMGEDI